MQLPSNIILTANYRQKVKSYAKFIHGGANYLKDFVSTSSHMLGRAIWDKLPESIFENFEFVRVKRGQF